MDATQRKYGWRADREDRAFLRATAKPFHFVRTFSAPEEIDPRPWIRIEDQGQIGSCSGNSLSTILELCNWIATRGGIVQLSRMFSYLAAQKIDNIHGDEGATISGAIRGAMQYGCCLESTFPYPTAYVPLESVPPAAIAEGKHHLLRSHAVMQNYRDCFEFLASGMGGVQIGINWTQELADNKSGVIESARGQNLGGHALAIVGYTRRKDRAGRNYLILINSWGEKWGNRGTAEIAPSLFDAWGRDGYSEMVAASDLQSFDRARDTDWVRNSPWFKRAA